jgi:ABC-type multidrug transport system fused ATPase/permease subunit
MIKIIREEQAHWSKRLFHSWIGPLIRAGQLRPIRLSDLSEQPPPEDSVEHTTARFHQAFQGNVLKALVASFRPRFIKIFFYLVILTTLNLLRPLILSELIGRLTPSNSKHAIELFAGISENLHMAMASIAAFFLLAFVRTHFLRHCFKLTWSMPGLLRTEVYKRLLHLEQRKRVQITAGEFVNIATRDCDSVSMLPFLIEPLLYPITILAYCLMLTHFLGPWALLAIVALAAVVPLGRKLERRMSSLATQIREQSKLRLGILGEILSGIKVIKFHAWENLFTKRVMQVRGQEVELMRARARVAAKHSALSALLPILTGATVVTLVSWFSGVPSTAQVFASFSIIATLVIIFSEIPDLLQSVAELKISLNRISQFLKSHPAPLQTDNSSDNTIELNQASFRRFPTQDLNDSQEALSNLSLKVEAGQCVAIVGAIGSGKSTLLSAMLGELQLSAGQARLPHPISYAPQIPWNQNATVKENIVFQLSTDDPLLRRIVSASSLSQDVRNWPAGIETEVGERGLNLSGGQKQRLALARSAYASLSQGIGTVLWDDPFSALDESVASSVFEELLLGCLGNKTRVFCTHRIDFALKSDWVVVMNSGRIVEQGAPLALLKQAGEFYKLHETHLSTRGQHFVLNDTDEPEQERKLETEQPLSDAGKLTAEEQVSLPVFNKQALSLYFRALAPAVGVMGVVGVFMLPRLTDIGSNLWLGHWTSHPSDVELSTAVGVFAALTLVTVIAERTRSVLLFDGGVKAGTRFFSDLLSGVMSAPMRFFDTSPLGRVLNRFTSDTNAVDNSMPSSVGQFLTSVIGVLISLFPVVVSQPVTATLLAPVAGLYFWLFRWVRKAQLRLNALTQVVRSPWMSLTSETLPGLSVVQSLQVQDRFLNRYKRLVNRHISTGFYVIATNLWFAFRLEVLGVALVGGFIILLTMNPDSASPTWKAVGLTFGLQTIGILGSITRSLRMLENNLISVDRMTEYASLKPEQSNHETPEDLHNWPAHGKIRINNLTAAYAEGLTPVLQGVTLNIPAGSKVGIIGRTGSGKSSLFLALTRILPLEENMIFIDEIDITKLSLNQLRRAIAMIPQDPVLFSGSLRDNLDPFAQHTAPEISTALRRAHLQRICSNADDAEKLIIEEGGRNLSVGERQLVCLARALLSKAKILLIDEATANVDVVTDALIQQTLREEFAHCTQLIIAHRTNTLKGVDSMVRLNDGRLAQIN